MAIKVNKELDPQNKENSDRAILPLGYIGQKIANYVSKITKHKIEPKDIYVTHLSSNADAIAYCKKQYNFFNIKQKRPDLTPLYFYSGTDQSVVKMKATLGSLDIAVNKLNEQDTGIVFKPIKSLLV